MYIHRQKFQQFDDSTILTQICICWLVIINNSKDTLTRDILFILLHLNSDKPETLKNNLSEPVPNKFLHVFYI